jgi:hypothetical protein
MRLPVSQYGNTVSQDGNHKVGRTWYRQAVAGTGAAAAEQTPTKNSRQEGRQK